MSKIYTLWPDGSYSSMAARKVNRGLNYTIEYKWSISNVIDSTTQGFYGIIPIHNIYWWVVQDSYDGLLGKKDLLQTICFVQLQINHCLASGHGENINDIKKIYSHSQALRQCEIYLKSIQTLSIPVSSTTEKIWDLKFGEWIICSKDSAENAWLDILEERVSPVDNITMFLFISSCREKRIKVV